MTKEQDFCPCKERKGVYAEVVEWGYYLYCSDCEKPLEDEFHYFSEEELFN